MDPIVYWEQQVRVGAYGTASRHLRRDRYGRVYFISFLGRYCVVRSGDEWEVSHFYTGEDGRE